MQAFDTTEDTTTHMGCLSDQHIQAVGRYYSRHRNWKCLKRREAEALGRAGVKIFAVYQDRQDRLQDFGYDNGQRAAREALSYAQDIIGQPAGSAIYFSVDYNASANMVEGPIKDFFQAINEGFARSGANYQIGVYGSGLTCRLLLDGGLVSYTWLSQSTGHREHATFKQSGRWNLLQGPLSTFCGMKIDSDELNPNASDFGAFAVEAPSIVSVRGADYVETVTRAAVETGQAGDAPSSCYPDRTIRPGEYGSPEVAAIQQRLNWLGYGPLMVDGDYGEATANTIMFFQARNVDLVGSSLELTGEVEVFTWGALFGPASVRDSTPLDAVETLRDLVVQGAAREIGVVEHPRGSNRGPEIDEYIRTTGLNPTSGSYAWCVCFLYWVFEQAAKTKGLENPLPKTAGVHALWQMGRRRAGDVVTAGEASAARLRPGMIFTLDTGGGYGHAGLVIKTQDSKLVTIEGNTNNGGSRDGYGVFRRESRPIRMARLLGYLDFC